MIRPPLPPFTVETATQKVRMAEDAWNTRDPERVALAYTEDSRWRNRAEFFQGRPAIIQFLRRKWARELDYRLIKELWAVTDNRIAVRFQYEWHDDAGNWYRAHGNEQWEFDAAGLMRRREASINDVPIRGGRQAVPLAPRTSSGGPSRPEPARSVGRGDPAPRHNPENRHARHRNRADPPARHRAPDPLSTNGLGRRRQAGRHRDPCRRARFHWLGICEYYRDPQRAGGSRQRPGRDRLYSVGPRTQSRGARRGARCAAGSDHAVVRRSDPVYRPHQEG